MRFIVALLIAALTSVSSFAVTRPSTVHETYFEGTDAELHVYSIYGRRDGNTMFMLGGIQGDEPGGYLSADLYSRLKLEQGNLIVIPRANLKSIILYNRGIDGDMNRLFTDNINDKTIKVIVDYMSKSDIFLNLHDGWGFHNSTYIDSQRNPNRFGQSVIVDEDIYFCTDNRTIDLKVMAQSVLESANARIPNKDHKLAYFNTRTGDPKTTFKDMQKTATWYALRKFCIPAFGIESSKNLKSLEHKVLYHNYAINEFMKQMDIIPEQPVIYISPAVLEYAIVTVNGDSVTVNDGDTIKISRNDIVSVTHIESNYGQGLSCDILGFGNLNDINKAFSIGYSTKIIFRKEDAKFAEVTLQVVEATAVIDVDKPYQIFLSIDGETTAYQNGKTVKINIGSTFKILRIEKNGKDLDLPVNLRGWVPPLAVNDGDDRGYVIPANPKEMLTRYSVNNTGKIYPITVNNAQGEEIARIYIELVN